jgi:hypothetical protein
MVYVRNQYRRVWKGVAKALLAFALGEKNIHNVSFKLTHEIRIMWASCLE